MNRRSFLNSATRISASLALLPAVQSWASRETLVSIRLRHADPTVYIPADFIGFGYEMSSVASIGLLSVTNRKYVRLVRNLGRKGVFRVGGIVADFTRYQPEGSAVSEPKNTIVTRASLEQFHAFLKQTGWTAIWSLNFGRGSLDDAVVEAKDVAEVLGASLKAIEIGNEVENYGRGEKPLRKPPYSYETFRTEYETWHAAITKAVPNIRYAAPDTAASTEWVERMASDPRGEVQLLTTHYYRGGQRQGTAEQLNYADPDLKAKLIRLRRASQDSGIPWRMCETNSFFGGGRPGVSDTLAGALWTLDYMLLLAQYGCAGVNIETGMNQLGFISSYSPIQDNGKGVNMAGVPYYGMLAYVSALSNARGVMPADVDTRGINLSIYILGSGNKPRAVVAVNRDSSRDAHLSLTELGMSNMNVLRLLSPLPDDTRRVTFGGASVDEDGRWRPSVVERIHQGRVLVLRMSAIVIHSADSHVPT